jgi:hypothetical protein
MIGRLRREAVINYKSQIINADGPALQGRDIAVLL